MRGVVGCITVDGSGARPGIWQDEGDWVSCSSVQARDVTNAVDARGWGDQAAVHTDARVMVRHKKWEVKGGWL